MLPMTKGRIILAGAVALLAAVLVAADLLVEHHPYFTIDGWPAFAAVYGALSGLAAIGLAAAWSRVARADETAAEAEGRDD